MFNKLKNIFKKNQPVWNESTGEVNITQLPTYDGSIWLPTLSSRINKIERILKKI